VEKEPDLGLLIFVVNAGCLSVGHFGEEKNIENYPESVVRVSLNVLSS
jgi:hypothetical protein